MLHAGGNLLDSPPDRLAVEGCRGPVMLNYQSPECFVLCGEYQSVLEIVYQLTCIGGEAVIGIVSFFVIKIDIAHKARAFFSVESLDAGAGDVVD